MSRPRKRRFGRNASAGWRQRSPSKSSFRLACRSKPSGALRIRRDKAKSFWDPEALTELATLAAMQPIDKRFDRHCLTALRYSQPLLHKRHACDRLSRNIYLKDFYGEIDENENTVFGRSFFNVNTIISAPFHIYVVFMNQPIRSSYF